MLGPETIEVSTFRAADPETAEKDEHGRIARQRLRHAGRGCTAARFHVNALYFDPETEEVVDFHGGLADLKKRVLRVIGDPQTRYREDPNTHAAGGAARGEAGLTLDPATRARSRAGSAPRARAAGALVRRDAEAAAFRHASACLRQLRDVGLHKGVLPLLDVILEQPLGERFVTLALAQTDERVLAERPVSRPSCSRRCSGTRAAA